MKRFLLLLEEYPHSVSVVVLLILFNKFLDACEVLP